MKKLLTQISVVTIALTIAATAFAQSPTATRQRRTSADDTQAVAPAQPSATPEVTADAQTKPFFKQRPDHDAHRVSAGYACSFCFDVETHRPHPRLATDDLRRLQIVSESNQFRERRIG